MDWKLPERLGIWRLGALLHANETVCVTRAQPVDAIGSPRWDYVVKLGDRQNVQWLIDRSINAGAALAHPNIVPVLDGDATGQLPYLVMPALEGKTMQWHLKRGPKKPLPVALWLVRQVCQAIESMRLVGWTHGNITPNNLIVGSNGHVTLIDFASAHDGLTDNGFIPPLQVFRSATNYMAPEISQGTESTTHASDLFATGKILWEWLTRVDTSNEIQLSPVCELVEQMVDQIPTRRPTAGEVTQALLRLEIDTLGDHIGPDSKRRAA
ncbi:protein kinase [Stieleria sp. TO1_6]|uniref:protein kinase domain-containing protein n=1 Tax=Stieleria tagensis TaxID=2956795 RepID=UPI00209AE846|nr:protein kinase [Stieleria tagensis]MCO8120721.1 protein kinase [Stieleria tagensis]